VYSVFSVVKIEFTTQVSRISLLSRSKNEFSTQEKFRVFRLFRGLKWSINPSSFKIQAQRSINPRKILSILLILSKKFCKIL